MWEASREAGVAVHSNSWGYIDCLPTEETYYNDKWLVEVCADINFTCCVVAGLVVKISAGHAGGQESIESC